MRSLSLPCWLSGPRGACPVLPGLERLRCRTLGDRRVSIAVIDGPVDLAHPCFAGAELAVVETLASGEAGGPALRHGTAVASLIFGQPGSPLCGIAPRCRGLIVPVFAKSGEESVSPCSQIDLARALLQAAQRGAQIINVSGGEPGDAGTAHPLLARAVRTCADAGILIVAAAGNDGCRCLHLPAGLPGVLAVGAMDGEGRPLGFSNWGEAYRRQGILAPGENVPGAVPGGGSALYSGTSYAAAVVSGVLALLLSLQLARGRRPDARQVRDAVLRTALRREGRPAAGGERLLGGRLDLPGALDLLDEGESMELSEPLSLQDLTGDGSGESAPAEAVPWSLAGGASASGPGEVPGRLAPSDCGCKQGPAAPPDRVYALGLLDYDFGSEARRDSFVQQGLANPDDAGQLLAHLDQNPWSATALTWVLAQETTPIYAIRPGGAFVESTYALLQRFLRGQLDGDVEQISIPGTLVGKARLSLGQEVPLIWPEPRGMYSWSTSALVAAVLGEPAMDSAAESEKAAEIANFLERIYYEVRNLGLAPQERAINYAATNAFQLQQVYSSAIGLGLKLDGIGAERSPICRPESDCWDVKLTFFHPTERQQHARVVYRFTVDVSDVVPVTVGKVRHWHLY